MLSLSLGHKLSGLGETSENVYSLAFNGTDEYVDLDNVADAIEEGIGTISVWVKLNTTSSTMVMVQARADASNYINVYYHNGTSEGRIAYRAAGSTKTAVFTDAIENDGKWHHIAAIWDADADSIQIYLDGTLKDTTTGLATFAGAITTCDIAQNTAGASYFDGNITEVAIFTRSVPISELFTADRQPIDLTGSDDLVGYYKCDEGSGVVAADSSGNNNNGDLINTPTWSTDVPYRSG